LLQKLQSPYTKSFSLVTGNTSNHNCATCLYTFSLSQGQCQLHPYHTKFMWDNGKVQNLEISVYKNTPVTNARYTFPYVTVLPHKHCFSFI
jgi:hypothetical protein